MDDYERELQYEQETGVSDLHVVSNVALGAGVAGAALMGKRLWGLPGMVAVGTVGALAGWLVHRNVGTGFVAKGAIANPTAMWTGILKTPGEQLMATGGIPTKPWHSIAKMEKSLGDADDFSPIWTAIIPPLEASIRDLLWTAEDELFEAVLAYGRAKKRPFLEKGRDRGMTLGMLVEWVKLLEVAHEKRDDTVQDFLTRRLAAPRRALKGKLLSQQLAKLHTLRNPLVHGRRLEIDAERSATEMKAAVGVKRFAKWWAKGALKRSPWVRLLAGHSLALARDSEAA